MHQHETPFPPAPRTGILRWGALGSLLDLTFTEVKRSGASCSWGCERCAQKSVRGEAWEDAPFARENEIYFRDRASALGSQPLAHAVAPRWEERFAVVSGADLPWRTRKGRW